MYLIQFCLQFFYEYSLYIQEIVIIKATRLQAGAPAGGGGGGKSRPSAPPSKIRKMFFGYIGGLFATFFSFLRPFHHVGAFRYFLLHGGVPFWACHPPIRKCLQAPMIARRVREHSPRKFFV